MTEAVVATLAGRCPADLRQSAHGYSRMGRLALWGGAAVSPQLAFDLPRTPDLDAPATQQLGRLSLSGLQEKYSLRQDGRELSLTGPDAQGTHILKPIISTTVAQRPELMPANEHLSMRLAAQVFDLRTAPSGLLFFADGTPAYVTRRFDVRDDGGKWAVEDFAALAGRTPATHGPDFKYEGHYLELFELLRQYVGAYVVEAGALFELLVFNYLIGNGDAHYKNFSLRETRFGDYVLAPAYDLLNTTLHVSDTPFALHGGLLPTDLARGKIGAQFRVLAAEAGLPGAITQRFFERLPAYTERVAALIERSFLPERARRSYLQGYQTRLRKLLRE